MIKHATLALSAALLATAAGAAAPNPRTLIGSNWQIVRIDNAAPASGRAVISFTRDRVSANVGCNGMGGSWRIARGKLIGGPYASTMMFCEGVMEQERAMGELLGASPRIDVTRDRLTLRSGKHSMEAVRLR